MLNTRCGERKHDGLFRDGANGINLVTSLTPKKTEHAVLIRANLASYGSM